MFNARTLTVIKRELKEKLFSKTFIFMTLLIPIFMFGVLGIQTFIMSFEGDKETKLLVAAESEQLTEGLKKEFEARDFIKNKYYSVSFAEVKKADFGRFLSERKKELINEKLNGLIYISDSAMGSKKIEYYSKNPNNNTVFNKLKNPINKVLIAMYFSDKNLSDKDINYAKEGVDFNTYRVSKDENVSKEGYGNQVVAFVLTFLLYMSMIFAGTQMMRSVIEEKTSRIVEVILSSVNAQELMTGKIIGGAITGFFQMAIWISPLFILLSTTIFVLPPDLVMKISMWQVGYFLLNYIIGSITFLGLFASVGAIFDNDQDAQSGIWPVMILIMIPFFISLGMMSNADNAISKIASMFPFASIIVMPSRMALIETPLYEIIIAMAVNLATMVFVFGLAGKIYRIGILLTGKKPKWSEVIGWLKIKY